MLNDTNNMHTESSLSFANPNPLHTTKQQKFALAAISVGLFMPLLMWFTRGGIQFQGIISVAYLFVSFTLITVGTYFFVRGEYAHLPEGIKNNGVWFRSLTMRGVFAFMLGILLCAFYTCLYWYPEYLYGLIRMFDPLSYFLRNAPADQWFTYGTFYTASVLLMGYKFAMKYRNNPYQLIRTASVCFFQLIFSFMLPSFFVRLHQPEYYFTYFWPLDYHKLVPDWKNQFSSIGSIGFFIMTVTLILTFFATPILTYFYGKRWYCSWVCGCGALAETVGDPFRQLSDKRLNAWKFERFSIYTVLVLVTVMTILLWVNSFLGGAVLGSVTMSFSKWYGFIIGSMFSGVIGTGFYPILGARSWCRFGCPQAAILGIFQKKKSKFRITTNGGQCISCGNCSTYCEMGIDVRHYAQRGQDIVRASCVGCGICSAVCPRGVLRLENADLDIDTRTSELRTIHLSSNKATINM